jgi:NRPS condensation-like uncharacterized protein
MSLCHALSDGPGALQVANLFLCNLAANVDNNESTNVPVPQQLTDLQALILGDNYCIHEVPKPVFEGQDDFTASLTNYTPKMNDVTVLPPEAMQNIPQGLLGGDSSTSIECVYFTLNANETSALRQACRNHETTVQGAITAASLKTRAQLLELSELPELQAAVQVPVNTRSFVNVGVNECLCGSAGVWHLAR